MARTTGISVQSVFICVPELFSFSAEFLYTDYSRIGRSQCCHKGAVDIRGGDGFSAKFQIASGAGILHNGAIKIVVKGSPGRRIDTHVTHGAADNQFFYILSLLLLQKRSLPETVGIMFLDD